MKLDAGPIQNKTPEPVQESAPNALESTTQRNTQYTAQKSSQPTAQGIDLSRPLTHGNALKMLQVRLPNWRPQAWEDDTSCNTLDSEPFSNLGPANELVDEIGRSKSLLQTLPASCSDEAIAELLANDTVPIPSPADRENYSIGNDFHYWVSGLADFQKTLEVLERYDVQPSSMLELGCATGRVLRHFSLQSDVAKIYGSDLNGRHVRWLSEYMPDHVMPIFNHCFPTLPIRDGSLDLITAYSVFSHIDTFETGWMAELARMLSPDGLCYLTVHNDDTWSGLASQLDNANNRLVQTMIELDPETPDKLRRPIPPGRTVYRFRPDGPYRANVFYSNDYLQKVWGRFFKIEEILPCHHGFQSVLVMRHR